MDPLRPPPVLIATLGAEPQVVALAADLLRQAGELLQAVVVLHSAPDRLPISHSLPALQAIFAAHPDWPPLICRPLPTADALTPDELHSFADALYQTLQSWLQQGARIHLLLAGGRKSMAMIGMSVAQTTLGADDCVWYLWSGEALRRSGEPRAAHPDDARLIAIPLPRLSPIAPVYTAPLQAADLSGARAALERVRQQRLRRFVEEELTAAERAIAALLVRELLTVRQLAERLHKSPKTVQNQLNQIYAKMEAAFGLLPDRSVKREVLRRELAPWFEQDARRT